MTNGVNLLAVANRDQLLLDNHLLIYVWHGRWIHHAINGLTPELPQIIRFGAAITFLCNGLALFLEPPGHSLPRATDFYCWAWTLGQICNLGADAHIGLQPPQEVLALPAWS
jgi:hypothetical protein